MTTHLPSEIIKFTHLVDSSKLIVENKRNKVKKYPQFGTIINVQNLESTLEEMICTLEEIKYAVADYCFLNDMHYPEQNNYMILVKHLYNENCKLLV